MADEFSKSVEFGLQLSKRIYYGRSRSMSPPKPEAMEKSSPLPENHLPSAPMVYAVITEPSIVDNPDIPSYQPYVYGRCEPPALIPLHMHGIAMEVDCYLDTAFVTVSGTWRVHCVMASKSCDCRIAIPMGEQGSVLGVEVDSIRRSYYTQLITIEDTKDTEKVDKAEDGCLVKGRIYTLKVPQVDGGSKLSIKVTWSQKILYQDGQFCLSVPFSFPVHVIPVGKKISKREKILLNVNTGTGTEVLCKTSSHPLKELKRQVGKLGFSYEAEVLTWSITDFSFSYTVSSSDIFGGLLLQSPSLHDFDQREMFCFYLFPGYNQSLKVFRKEVVFIVDISGSMQGGPLENAKNALLAALSELNPVDLFNIIAFSGNTQLFSSSMELATNETIENVTQWIDKNLIAEGGTNILAPLNQAIEMVANTSDAIPLIFLITDGAVEDERHICNVMKGHLMNRGLISPRINTFGIGSYCNHYFLQMLAQIGRGYYDAAYDVDSINFQMQRLLNTASSVILANITIDALEQLDSVELYPFQIPDLLSGSPLIISGRYHGDLPNSLKVSGTLADMSNFTVDVKVQKAKDMPLDKVFAKRQIDKLTSHAWLMENKELEEKVAKLSIQTGTPSEYTRLILVQTDKGKQASGSILIQEQKMANLNGQQIIFLRNLGVGFGNLIATAENLSPIIEEAKLHETADTIFRVASNCCSRVLDRCCCMCFIQACSRLNDQCAIALTQLCTALACFECLSCCCELCASCD
uniref:Putative inter-alpha-trypsin inhibitor heavy chain H3 isoform X1 n=1 Tax=Davidia involucrata TaxID=16924 RepID=A0A5B6Z9T2_DAVIN